MAIINGKFEDIANTNLLEYLNKNNYKIDRLVVEYNGKILKKIDLDKIEIKNTDKIEIISFVGGG